LTNKRKGLQLGFLQNYNTNDKSQWQAKKGVFIKHWPFGSGKSVNRSIPSPGGIHWLLKVTKKWSIYYWYANMKSFSNTDHCILSYGNISFLMGMGHCLLVIMIWLLRHKEDWQPRSCGFEHQHL
jgi:hypothetical protein